MLKISLKIDDSIAIPINYKYKLCSYIYALLKEGDAQLSSTIHNDNSAQIKPFVFSDLIFEESENLADTFIILSGNGVWYFSSINEECLEIMKKKIWKGIIFKVGSKELVINVVDVEEVNPTVDSVVEFNTMSPIIVYSKMKNTFKPISPNDEKYIRKIKTNLCKKHFLLHNEKIDVKDFTVKFIPNGDKILENFKGNMLFGHYGTIVINGPESIKRTVLECGIGQQTSGGFGFCIPNERGDIFEKGKIN